MSDVTIEYETIRGDKDFSEKVAPDRLLERIDDIKRRFQDGLQAPYGVDVVNEKGDRMTVGFDDSEGFLMLQPGSDQEWTQYSLGDVRRDGYKAFHLPQWSELSSKYMVPTPRLREAVRHWAETGELGEQVRWTTESY
jgi:hypothetical protein